MKWSYSTHITMRRCQRQLVFSRLLASHNARDTSRREAYILKHAQDFRAWQGSLIHKVLATDGLRAIRHRRSFVVADLVARTLKLAERQLAFSAARRYREPGQTKMVAGEAYCVLAKHEHGLEMPSDVLVQVEHTARRCFQNLAGQETLLAELYAASGHLAEEPVYFRMDGMLVVAVPDLVFVNTCGRVGVIDWKIAQSERSDYTRQMLVNALVVARSGRGAVGRDGRMDVYEVNLLRNTVRQHDIDGPRLDDVQDFVYRSVADFKALVGHVTADDVDLDDYDVAASDQVCRHCHFRTLCLAQLHAVGRTAQTEAIQGGLW